MARFIVETFSECHQNRDCTCHETVSDIGYETFCLPLDQTHIHDLKGLCKIKAVIHRDNGFPHRQVVPQSLTLVKTEAPSIRHLEQRILRENQAQKVIRG